MPNPVLEIKNLSITFHNGNEKISAVKNLSFSLEKGSTLGIVGESGSGKSVTALSVLRLLPRDQASVSAGGVFFHSGEKEINLLSLSEKEMRNFRGNRISMVFQEPMTSLNPVKRCGAQVMESIRVHQDLTAREARKRVLGLFREVQLPRPEEIYRSYPHELSGGQKQRVMISMAISSKPDILIADEPTTALDVTVQKTILELIRDLQNKYGMAVLFITHDLGVISHIARDVLIMKEGEIVEKGSVGRVLNSPEHPYTKGLLACRPRMDLDLEKLPTVKDFLSAPGATYETFIQQYDLDSEKMKLARKRVYSSAPLLKVDGLKTWFPLRRGFLSRKKNYIRAVDDVTLDIYPGETVGLVGESGCGKTTLGRSILRLVEPEGGKVIYNGKNVLELPVKALRKMRKNLQIVFQDPYSSLNPRLKAGDSIMEPMIVHKLHGNSGSRKEKTVEIMEKVGLDRALFDRYPHEFSGGQRQRICIARALAVEPDVIVCDESVSALDVSIQAQVLNLLNELKKDLGLTFLFISHDLSVVKHMADRIIVMKNGKIEEEGSAKEIYRNPGSEYTKDLIDAILE